MTAFVGPPAFAQTAAGGRVEGRIVDPDGLGVPGVQVQLQGPALRTPCETLSTSSDGGFRFEGLPAPGTYTISTPGAGLYTPAAVTIARPSASMRSPEALCAL